MHEKYGYMRNSSNKPLHGILGSREIGGQNNQGAGGRVGKSLGSREKGK